MAWIFLAAIAATCWLLWQVGERRKTQAHSAKEPPLIPPSIPYIGHLLGILRDGSCYYRKISKRFPLPIYTLRLPGKKMYIVTSHRLVSAVDRQAKTLSFDSFGVEISRRMVLPSPAELEALKLNLHTEDRSWGFRPESFKAMYRTLAPGSDLEDITQAFLRSVLSFPGPVSGIMTDEKKYPLFDWGKRLVTRASTDAIFGENKNPFQDPTVEAAFWAVDKAFAYLGVNILPGLLAPAAHRGRKKIFSAFRRYHEQGGHLNASRLVQARYEVQQKYSISATDIQHFNLNICFGLLSNTVSVVPWVLFYIYSRPSLLEASRIAVSHYIHTSKNNNSNNSAGVAARDQHYRADIAAIAAGCPLLASVFQETLRVQSTNAQGRVVLKDTLLNGQYVLKKDSVVLIPSAELHNNASIWGASCKEFDPLRFTVPGGNNHNNHKGQHGAKKFIPPGQAAYRAFGGGAHLCPGRFLAENQTMIIVVIMLLRYDLVPAAGRWVLPECRPHISATILMPTEDIQVRIEERRGYENARWEFTWGGGDGGETTRA